MRVPILFLFLVMGIDLYSQLLVDTTQNYINNWQSLSRFFQDLDNAKRGKKKIQILHIGDSHIQSGFLTEQLRYNFQREYGNAGRGLVFPFRLAKTNGHMDVRFSSDIEWDRFRIITDDAPKVGISGATIYTNKPKFYVKMKVINDYLPRNISIIGNGLSQLQLAIPKENIKVSADISRKILYKVKPGDVLGRIARRYGVKIKQIKKWNKLHGSLIRIGQKLAIYKLTKGNIWELKDKDFNWIKPYELSDSTFKVVIPEYQKEIYFIKRYKNQNRTVKFYGLHLENKNSGGVLYDGIGINGAKYTDYNKSPLFFKQLSSYKPDLVILSLGTNEAFDKVYRLEQFRDDIEQFCDKVVHYTKCQSILLTTPPSALLKRRYPNEKLEEYSKALRDIAKKRGYAVWDLFTIMRGKKGMKLWYDADLAGKDRIHFKPAGYQLQGNLLYKALQSVKKHIFIADKDLSVEGK